MSLLTLLLTSFTSMISIGGILLNLMRRGFCQIVCSTLSTVFAIGNCSSDFPDSVSSTCVEFSTHFRHMWNNRACERVGGRILLRGRDLKATRSDCLALVPALAALTALAPCARASPTTPSCFCNKKTKTVICLLVLLPVL